MFKSDVLAIGRHHEVLSYLVEGDEHGELWPQFFEVDVDHAAAVVEKLFDHVAALVGSKVMVLEELLE